MRLNKEQQQLVEKNHNLIYSFLKDKNLDLDSTDDWYGIAAEGLCNAALGWDSTKEASFSRFAYVCMGDAIKNIYRVTQRTFDNSTLSLDVPVKNNIDLTIKDIIQNPSNQFEMFEVLEAIKISYDELSDRDKEIVNKLFFEEHTVGEIAKQYNRRSSTISMVKSKFINNIKSKLEVDF